MIQSHVVENQQARSDVTGIRGKVNYPDPRDVCESSLAKMAAMQVTRSRGARALGSSHPLYIILQHGNAMLSSNTGGLQCKSTVYGLNGHRAFFVIALSVAICEHGTLESRRFTALFSWTPELSVGDRVDPQQIRFLVAKGNCTAAVDRSHGADGRQILACCSLFRSLNRAMETSVKMKFLLDQIEDVGVRCGPTIDII